VIILITCSLLLNIEETESFNIYRFDIGRIFLVTFFIIVILTFLPYILSLNEKAKKKSNYEMLKKKNIILFSTGFSSFVINVSTKQETGLTDVYRSDFGYIFLAFFFIITLLAFLPRILSLNEKAKKKFDLFIINFINKKLKPFVDRVGYWYIENNKRH